MTEIRVRQCTARVRRRGGWGWGDPAAYVDGVAAAIEAALDRAVAEADLPPGADLTLGGSVTMAVGSGGLVTAASHRTLVEQLRAAAARTPNPIRASADASPRRDPRTRVEADSPAAAEAVPPVIALVAALAGWSRSGRLEAVLRSWPSAAVSAWTSVLFAGADDQAAAPTGMLPEGIDALARALDEHAADSDDRRPGTDFLLLAGAVAAALGDRVPDRATVEALARRAGLHPLPSAAWHRDPATSASPTQTETPAPSPRELASQSRPAGPPVVPALPFLVLVQLHRLGFLAPATSALAAAGVTPAGAALAAAVAGKALSPPRHGWQRTPAERRAVELASGLTAEEIDATAGLWAENADVVCGPLRAVLAGLYAEGRSRYDELAVTRVDDDVLWGEEAGLLPISWAAGEDDLSSVAAVLGDPPHRDSQVLAPLVDALAPRRGLPGRNATEIERVLGAVTGTALGSLAQELWGREADTLLALERLGDLEALIRVGERTTIGVPRGQRWLDLRRVGLLDAWPAPWAPGGLWELVTW